MFRLIASHLSLEKIRYSIHNPYQNVFNRSIRGDNRSYHIIPLLYNSPVRILEKPKALLCGLSSPGLHAQVSWRRFPRSTSTCIYMLYKTQSQFKFIPLHHQTWCVNVTVATNPRGSRGVKMITSRGIRSYPRWPHFAAHSRGSCFLTTTTNSQLLLLLPPLPSWVDDPGWFGQTWVSTKLPLSVRQHHDNTGVKSQSMRNNISPTLDLATD